jgi:hypothetical protein
VWFLLVVLLLLLLLLLLFLLHTYNLLITFPPPRLSMELKISLRNKGGILTVNSSQLHKTEQNRTYVYNICTLNHQYMIPLLQRQRTEKVKTYFIYKFKKHDLVTLHLFSRAAFCMRSSKRWLLRLYGSQECDAVTFGRLVAIKILPQRCRRHVHW